MASRGLLWVGTNVGIALTVPLPRLEGVPIISGRANISYHAHFGSVTFFLNLQHKVLTTEVCITSVYSITNVSGYLQSHFLKVQTQSCGAPESNSIIQEESEKDLVELELDEEEANKSSLKKKFSDSVLPNPSALGGSASDTSKGACAEAKNTSHTLPPGTKLRHRNSSPILRRRPQITPANAATQMSRRSSKTLPRGFSLANAGITGDSLDCDVFGLYGELLNVRDYDCDSGERISMNDELRKSDPELSTIPYRYVYFTLKT